MPRVKLVCRNCGKEYLACKTPNPEHVFRWRDIACSEECARKYIDEAMRARAQTDKEE